MPTLSPEGFPGAPAGSPPAAAVDYLVGARQIILGCLDHRAFRFVPSMPLVIRETRSLSIRVEARVSASEADVDIYLWNPEEGFWTMFPWEGGEIEVGNPGRFMPPSGDLVVAVVSGSGFYLTIDTVISRAEVVLQDGTPLTLGPSAE